jgi:hypothetical protein
MMKILMLPMVQVMRIGKLVRNIFQPDHKNVRGYADRKAGA